MLENALFIVPTVYMYVSKNMLRRIFNLRNWKLEASLAICNLNKTFSDGSTAHNFLFMFFNVPIYRTENDTFNDNFNIILLVVSRKYIALDLLEDVSRMRHRRLTAMLCE